MRGTRGSTSPSGRTGSCSISIRRTSRERSNSACAWRTTCTRRWRSSTSEETYEFAELLSRKLEEQHPGEVTTEWLKRKRAGVLVDHRQNGHGKTIASVYSVRPKPGAPVSTPLHWDELTSDVRPRDFTMDVVLDRIDRRGDLFEPVLRGRQTLGSVLRELRREM